MVVVLEPCKHGVKNEGYFYVEQRVLFLGNCMFHHDIHNGNAYRFIYPFSLARFKISDTSLSQRLYLTNTNVFLLQYPFFKTKNVLDQNVSWILKFYQMISIFKQKHSSSWYPLWPFCSGFSPVCQYSFSLACFYHFKLDTSCFKLHFMNIRINDFYIIYFILVGLG